MVKFGNDDESVDQDNPIWLPQELGFDKPFIDYDFQIRRMIRRKLVLNDTQKDGAKAILQQHGYYQIINGYGGPFECHDSSKEKEYLPETNFSDIYNQYFIDHELGKPLFYRFLDIEEHLKTAMGYSVATHFGVNNYYVNDKKNTFPQVRSYLDVHNYPGAIKKPLRELHELSINCWANPTKYYRDHFNHIPPWILLMNAMEKQTFDYYAILPNPLKYEVIQEMLPDRYVDLLDNDWNDLSHLFNNGLQLMREFRNHIAHSSRMYSHVTRKYFLGDIIKKMLPKAVLTESEFDSGLGNGDLFAIMAWIILTSPDQAAARSFVDDIAAFTLGPLLKQSTKAEDVFYSQTKLPRDFVHRLDILVEYIV